MTAQSTSARLLDRGLYLFISLWLWGIVAAGFWPTYFGVALEGTLEKSLAVHIHVVVYLGWMVLFTVQSTLPMMRRTRLHRKLGRIGVGYAVVVFVMGIVVSLDGFLRAIGDGPVDENARRALLNPLHDMVVFPVLFGLAIRSRKNPEVHKRLMVLTATMLVIAAVFRMGFLGGNLLWIDLIWLSPILLAMLHDAVYQRRLHPVYGVGLPLMALVPARNLLVNAPYWQQFTDWLASVIR